MASTTIFSLKEQFQEKAKKLADALKRVNVPSFMPKEDQTKKKITLQVAKLSTKLLGKAQNNIITDRSRAFTNKEELQYDFLDTFIENV